MFAIKDVQVFWADTCRTDFHKLVDIDVPFPAQGCIHLQATVKAFFIKLGTIKIAIGFH